MLFEALPFHHHRHAAAVGPSIDEHGVHRCWALLLLPLFVNTVLEDHCQSLVAAPIHDLYDKAQLQGAVILI